MLVKRVDELLSKLVALSASTVYATFLFRTTVWEKSVSTLLGTASSMVSEMPASL